MDVVGRVEQELYDSFLERMPQVCAEVLLVERGEVLLARRTNEPAKGEWFWPGGRLYKGEESETAVCRIAREELGVAVDVDRRLGVSHHFWPASEVPERISRHTVNLVYRVEPAAPTHEVVLDDQHAAWEFVSGPRPDHHEHVRRYFNEYDVLGTDGPA